MTRRAPNWHDNDLSLPHGGSRGMCDSDSTRNDPGGRRQMSSVVSISTDAFTRAQDHPGSIVVTPCGKGAGRAPGWFSEIESLFGSRKTPGTRHRRGSGRHKTINGRSSWLRHQELPCSRRRGGPPHNSSRSSATQPWRSLSVMSRTNTTSQPHPHLLMAEARGFAGDS